MMKKTFAPLEDGGDTPEPVIRQPLSDEYDPGITKEQWLELLTDEEVTSADTFRLLGMMLKLGGESTCAELAEKFGGSPQTYSKLGTDFGELVHKKTGCRLREDTGERQQYHFVPFSTRRIKVGSHDRDVWILRSELREALSETDQSKIIIEPDKELNTMPEEFSLNTILYGPPGTGKTYNAAKYAVAICTGKTLEEVQAQDYAVTMQEYDQLKKEGRIARLPSWTLRSAADSGLSR